METGVKRIDIAKSNDVVSGAGGRASDSNRAVLGYDSFLRLLIAQMQNQDPLEPMKASDYVAQLATFSQVEKSVAMNDRLNSLLTTSRLQQAEAIVGRSLIANDGQVSGNVAAAYVTQGTVMAILEDGSEIEVGAGVIVSRASL